MMWLVVAAAGALGAIARFGLHRTVEARVTSSSVARLPWGTIIVNVVGSFAAGVVVGLVLAQGVDPDVRVVVATGFLGSFTTFSAFAFETVALVDGGAAGAALANVVGSVVAGLAAAALGLALTGAL
ncbi:MAG: fluoride efflux transporter CrcB [Acidimicrobiia bacterium]